MAKYVFSVIHTVIDEIEIHVSDDTPFDDYNLLDCAVEEAYDIAQDRGYQDSCITNCVMVKNGEIVRTEEL